MTDFEICETLLAYRVIKIDDKNKKFNNIWHEKFSEHLTFASLRVDNIDFELMIIDYLFDIESLDTHIINPITHQYRLSNKLHQILIEDGLINNLEDKLKDMHMYIRLKYL